MQLDLEPAENGNFIQSHTQGAVKINNEIFSKNLIVTPSICTTWEVNAIGDINTQSLQQLLDHNVEIILLGLGEETLFLNPDLIDFVYRHGVGIECMTTAAACRTFNVLLNENRNVLAALII